MGKEALSFGGLSVPVLPCSLSGTARYGGFFAAFPLKIFPFPSIFFFRDLVYYLIMTGLLRAGRFEGAAGWQN